MHRPDRRLPPRLALVLAGLLGALPAPGLHAQQGGAQGPPPAPVVVATAERRTLAPLAWYPGTVISRARARIPAEVAGRLEWVAEVGARIERGEPLARLDDTLLRQRLAEDQAAVTSDQARLRYLEGEVRRLRELVGKNNAARSRLEEAVSNRDVIHSDLVADRARLASTRERLERTVIRAPFPGVVTERLLQPGEWAESGQAVVRLVDASALEVQTWVPVSALRFVEPGSRLRLRASPAAAAGTVRVIVPVGDERSRLYELRVAIPADTWPVGKTLRVAVPSAAPREVVAVPRDALVLRRGAVSVYRVAADGRAERVEVEPGIAVGALIEVSGIEPGDRVVVRGGERLRPGQTVRVIGTSPAS